MPSIWQRTKAAYAAFREPAGAGVSVSKALPDDPIERYRLLRTYYDNSAYLDLNAEAARRGVKGLKFLDNPAYQAVEFHAAHLFPGSIKRGLPLDLGSNAAIGEPIQQILAWGNWAAEKQVYARTLGICGNSFIKAATNEAKTRAFPQLTAPEHVTDFEKDERGFIVKIRVDIPIFGEGGRPKTYTEYWDKAHNAYLVWPEHDKAPGTDIDILGEPDPDLSGEITDFGADFVPYVHAKFQDTGEPLGKGVFELFLEPMDEVNRAVNRLHQTYFRYDRPLTALARNEQGAGPANVRRDSPMDDETGEVVEISNEKYVRLPGLTTLEQIIPNIPYDAGLKMIDARHERLGELLAELRFYRDVAAGDPSGLARKIRLAPAVSRGIEARGNAEAALVRVVQMCLTYGTKAGLFGSEAIGNYGAGSFDFSFEEREILPVSDEERFASEVKEAEAYAAWTKLPEPLLRRYLEQRGYEDEDVRAIVDAASRRPANPLEDVFPSL